MVVFADAQKQHPQDNILNFNCEPPLIRDRHTAGATADQPEEGTNLSQESAGIFPKADQEEDVPDAEDLLSLSTGADTASNSDISNQNLLTLHVGNLSQAVDDAALFKKFAELGFVTSAQVRTRLSARNGYVVVCIHILWLA